MLIKILASGCKCVIIEKSIGIWDPKSRATLESGVNKMEFRETFEYLGSTISAAGKDGVSKAKEIRDAAKLSMDIKERENSIRKMFIELGKAYYHDHKNDEDPEFDLVLAIRAAYEEIGELKASKDEIRGVRRCVCCGSIVAKDAKFCANCGAKCEEEPQEEDLEEDFEEVSDQEVQEAAAESASEEGQGAPETESASEEE